MNYANVGETDRSLESGETNMLISADRVQGTAVYDKDSEKVGSVDSIMLNKYTGKVAYSVMSFGGFLGIGERYHPLPWDVLDYDVDLGGYKLKQLGAELTEAPHYSRSEIDNRDYVGNPAVGSWYGASPIV
jgi:sporulation protein YlmC with PRC-barrel domain